MSIKVNTGLILLLLLLPVSIFGATEVEKLKINDGDFGDVFGRNRFALNESDTALFGVWSDDDNGGDSGSVYVFDYINGSWQQQTKLFDFDPTSGGEFGWSVASDGDAAIVGARFDIIDPRGRTGSAVILERIGGLWIPVQKLFAPDGESLDAFGQSVAISGAIAIAGAHLSSPGGAAYIFERTGSTWEYMAKLTAEDGDDGDNFGYSVAIDGTTAIVGARFHDSAGQDAGAVYVFERSGDGWPQTAKLEADDATNFMSVGWDVAISAQTILVGAPGDNAGRGAAYLFSRYGNAWAQEAKLTASDGAANDAFGISVAIDGQTVLVGSPRHTDDVFEAGAAYLYRPIGGNWAENIKLIASDRTEGDLLGQSVALDGSTAMVGAPFDDNGELNTGAVYVFDIAGPVTSSVVANPNPVPVGTGIALIASVDDSTTGGSNIASAAYTIDGSTPVAMDAQDGFFDQVSEEVGVTDPGFSEAGVYEICANGTDEPGNTGADECILLAVYDPDGGFVTGGGWIDSPIEACPDLCNGATGKANFGFVSKYKKGASVPTGNTKFNFSAGGLNFHSDAYDWLVVNQNGANAQYKGSGSINGALAPDGEAFKFMLWATDGDKKTPSEPDTFRIKLWYEDAGSEVLVYDNGFDQPIGGGSIVVHEDE